MAGQIRQGKRSYEKHEKNAFAALALAVALGPFGRLQRCARFFCGVRLRCARCFVLCRRRQRRAESTGTPAAERTAFRIASLKGPTTMGLVKLMDEADKGEAATIMK